MLSFLRKCIISPSVHFGGTVSPCAIRFVIFAAKLLKCYIVFCIYTGIPSVTLASLFLSYNIALWISRASYGLVIQVSISGYCLYSSCIWERSRICRVCSGAWRPVRLSGSFFCSACHMFSAMCIMVGVIFSGSVRKQVSIHSVLLCCLSSVVAVFVPSFLVSV